MLVVNWVECDAANVIKAVHDVDLNFCVAGLVVNDVKTLCKVVGVVKCQAISRKSNGLAHTLPSLACFSKEDRSWFNIELSCIFSIR
ncbi:hypothetical protein ACOSQ4_015202 [Xanthoceras sorbifolium]